MAYQRPKDLDGFLPHLSKSDTKFRQQLGADLLAFLAEPSNPMTCQDIGQLIDGLIPWMQSSNYKVSSNGIEIMTFLIDRLGHDFKPYLQTVFPVVIDRLGDAKDTVREKAQLLILKLLERNVLSPQALLERLTPGFTHKNAKIREETLRCLINTLNEHGAQSVTLSKFVPQIVKLLSDPTSSVRDTALITLVDLYKHVGEKLRIDLQKRNLVPIARLPALLAKFDEIKRAGDLLPTASLDFTDEPDIAVMAKPAIPVKKAGLLGTSKRIIVSAPAKTTLGGSNSAGGVGEEVFIKLFEDVPNLQIFSVKDISDHMKVIQETIGDPNKDWNKRVDSLKKLRALVKAGAAKFDDFFVHLRLLEPPLEASIKDLRSQVVREACISVAYLAQQLGNKFEHSAESLLPALINLIQNSAKVVATAGHITVRFILQHIHNPRLIPIISNNLMYSKSKEIRKSCCEFLDQILENWTTHCLERHIALLQESLKRGIADADPDARNLSRKAFIGFKEHFPDQAEALLQSLEPSYQRALKGELSMSNSSSTNSLATVTSSRLPRQLRTTTPTSSKTDSGRKGFRSNSAIDLQAAQRAKARAQYAAAARQKIASGTASLQGEIAQQARPRRTPESSMIQSPEQAGRRRSRSSGVSHSQPTSRSGSPSSRIHYLYNRSEESPRPRRLSSGIPRSTTASRETSREGSPTRGSSISRLRTRNDRPPLSPASRPVMAQKILQQSREAENALADALCYDIPDGDVHRLHSPRKSMRSLDNPSDESETSSVCSERSFDSFRKTTDSYSWSGSQQRLASRDLWEPCRDIGEIIAMCRSTVWQERKDGLMSLRCYLESGAILLPAELKQITDIFTKMFMDSHTKSLSVFLESLNILIKIHKSDLHDWLYVLLQRIFHKLGTDLLNSLYVKLLATIEIIRKSFPVNLQFSCVCRFLVDSTQTPNSKTKVAALSFLTSLCNTCEQTQFIPKSPTLQALQKIIMFSQDAKSPEIRNAARNCIVAMWNWNTPQITMMLGELPKEQQDIASYIVHNHLRKSSSGSETTSPMVGTSPKTSSPITPTARSDDMNHEDIYRSLRKTTAEIQNYNYESLGNKLDRNRVTTSQDSGISQMSVGCDIKNDVAALEERIEELKISPDFVITNESHSLPCTVNGIEKMTNGFNSLEELSDRELVQRVIETCVVDNPTPDSEKQKLLSQLIVLFNSRNVEAVKQNFKKLLRLLLDNVNWKNKSYSIQVLVLQIFSEIFKNPEFKPFWSQFVELLTLRVLEAHCSEKREVVKMAETTAATMNVFPFNTVVNVLSPMIQTNIGPTLHGAIKMLTKLVETNPDQVTDEHLEKIMPGLIKANDHEESSIRKCAVFCMVALHKAVGEERLAPYIACLPGSKIKLLRVYITKAQSSSLPTSPKISSNTQQNNESNDKS